MTQTGSEHLPDGESPPPETADTNAAQGTAALPENGVVDDGRSFAKPNLVLKDPDRYAFANRIRRLTFMLAGLCLIVSGPFIASRFVYYFRYAQLQAGHDFSSSELESKGPSAFGEASRLVALRVSPSVVSIQTPGVRSARGQGSGVIVDESGYILTNFHVVLDAVNMTLSPAVMLEDGRHTYAEIVGFDEATDLAVLKIDMPNLIPAEWGDSNELQVGDLVWAAGSPFGLDRSVTFGIVSAKARRSEDGVTQDAYQEYLQTDVAVNRGNSGGPLVDAKGRLVGINTAIVGDFYRGISFAIPSNLAKRQYDLLKRNGTVSRGYLGVTPASVPESQRRRLNLERGEGVFVAETVRPGPASDADIRRGDVILSWNDHQATDPLLLSRVIASTEIGSTAKVVVKRVEGGRAVELPIDVEVGVRTIQ